MASRNIIQMKDLWFKAKQFGWGWYPAAWQGWTITLCFILLVAWCALAFSKFVFWFPLQKKMLSVTFVLLIIGLIIALFWICFKKGERPRWRWGN